MKDRLKLLRHTLGLTQQKFADKLGIKGNTISQYESGRNAPIDAVISLICREFNVSEPWLRTGKGEMFVPAPSGTLDEFIRERNLSQSDRILIEKLASLDSKGRQAVVDYVLSVADEIQKSSLATLAPSISGPEQSETDLAAKIVELERQNQELAAKVAAMEEEDALLGLTDVSSKSPSVSVGNFSPASKAKK